MDTTGVQRKRENTWRKDFKKEVGTAVFNYSWRKMEVTAQDGAGWRPMVCGHVPLGAKINPSKSVILS